MRVWILLLVSIWVGGWVVGCGDDSVSPRPGQFSLSVSNLPQLPADQYYEAWARFPDSVAAGNPLLHGELEAVSLGAFTVANDGTLWSLDGETPAQFALSEPRDLNVVVDVLVTVESALEDTVAGPAILGGEVTGNDDEGHASLTTTHHDAITDTMMTGDLTTAQGQCILATPTTSATDDGNHGVWFVGNDDPPQIPSLQLPVLGEGWVYSAWITHEAEPVGVGEFSNPAAADSDSAGAEAGTDGEGFDAPGSDFVQPAARNLADGATTVLVAVAPAPHDHGLSRLLHDEPFPLTVLELEIPLGARPDSAMTLTRPTAPLPTGNITFTR